MAWYWMVDDIELAEGIMIQMWVLGSLISHTEEGNNFKKNDEFSIENKKYRHKKY